MLLIRAVLALSILDHFGHHLKTQSLIVKGGAGDYSKKPCPRPTVGGCNVSTGTMNEIMIWHYNYGGDPFTAEVLVSTSKVCDANPFGSWVFGN